MPLLNLRTFAIAASVAWCTACSNADTDTMPDPHSATPATVRATAPMAEQRPIELEAHGQLRIDPYYWLRDDSRQDPEVLAHLQAENAYTQAVLASTSRIKHLFDGRIPCLADADTCVQRALPRTDRL